MAHNDFVTSAGKRTLSAVRSGSGLRHTRRVGRTACGAGRFHGCTLVEFLVVIAIIGILIALLLPAVQAAREAGRRIHCTNKLKQISLAAHNYHDSLGTFPPSWLSGWRNQSGKNRGYSLYIHLLPYIEMGNLYDRWDFSDPDLQFVGDMDSLAAKGPDLLCPSELERDNPLDYSTRHIQGSPMPPRHIKVTSYCGNAGTRSYHPDSGFFKADGIFIMAGLDSRPQPNQRPVRLVDIADGTSNTLFFGERSRWDPNYNTFAAQGWDWPLRFYGTWCGASRLVISHLTLSGYSPINYRLPFNYANRILVFSQRPGRIIQELPVHLPRPRDTLSRRFTELFVRVRQAVHSDSVSVPNGVAKRRP